MSPGTFPTIFLLVLVPVVGVMLAWVIWSVVKITQPLTNSMDEWELVSLKAGDEFELESSIVGVRQIQKRQRSRSTGFGDDYSYKAGENMGYGIPVSWIQNIGERKN